MLTWQEAHRIANMAAAQTHTALGVSLDGTRVDIVAAVRAAEVELMWQPMPRVFGVYLNEPGSRPGILVNGGLPPGARRHTLAHELGHHRLRHVTSVDDGSTIDTVTAEEYDAMPPASRRRAWPDQEKAAEAFAAWFLMPRRVVTTALETLGLQRPRTALDVYRLSLLLGTSFRSTVRHLPNLRLAHPQNCATWSRTAPGQIKASLDRGTPDPASRRPDVWLLDPGLDGITLHLHPGDRLVLAGVLEADADIPDVLSVIGLANPTGRAAGPALEVREVDEASEERLTINQPARETWSMALFSSPHPRGLDPRRIL